MWIHKNFVVKHRPENDCYPETVQNQENELCSNVKKPHRIHQKSLKNHSEYLSRMYREEINREVSIRIEEWCCEGKKNCGYSEQADHWQ